MLDAYTHASAIHEIVISQFGKRLDAIKGPLLVIGSATADARRDRATNLLLGRFGNHPLLDLGLTMEGLPRMDDRGRGEITSKSLRMLSRLLPNRVVVSPPSDEAALQEWKTMLESDIATMRECSNRAAIRALLGRCGMECPELDQVVVKDQALSSEAVEKIVGWAMANSLMHPEDTGCTADRFVIKVRTCLFSYFYRIMTNVGLELHGVHRAISHCASRRPSWQEFTQGCANRQRV